MTDRSSDTAENATALARAKGLEREGRLREARDIYVRLEQHAAAGKVSLSLKEPYEAAKWYVKAGMPYDAAVCYQLAAEPGRALDHLLKVPPSHRDYHRACMIAIRYARELGRLDERMAGLLERFAGGVPTGELEAEDYYAVAVFFQNRGNSDRALGQLLQIASWRPGFRDVAARVAALAPAKPAALPGSPASGVPARATGTTAPAPTTILPPEPARAPVVAPTAILPPELACAPVVAPTAILPPELACAPVVAPTAILPPELACAPVVAPTAILPASVEGTPSPARAPSVPAEVRTRTLYSRDDRPASFAAPEPDTLCEGSIIGARFQLVRKIGQGGMAAVFWARDLELGSADVAIKFLAHHTVDEALLDRFRQEVAILRSLSHPNIVRLFELGTCKDYKYVVMEYLRGQDLGAVLSSRTLPVAEAINYLVQACLALQAAHDRGITHRDVKPENLFITKEGVLKVMDFGIAKRTDVGRGLTRTGFLAGTPAYVAPEQILDFGRVNHLADLYGLGCVAYRMLAGRPPFVHTELVPLLLMHVNDSPQPLRRWNPDVPDWLDALVLRLLEKDPQARPQSCRELAATLSPRLQELQSIAVSASVLA